MNAPARLPYASQRHGHAHVEPGIRVRKLGRLGRYTVWTVNGERLRNEVDIDWVCGGNGARYGYAPKWELWVDSKLSPLDIMATALHEYVETELMFRKRMSYDRAHDQASATEARFREELAAEKCARVSLERVRRAVRASASI